MKKILLSTLLIGAILIVGCKKETTTPTETTNLATTSPATTTTTTSPITGYTFDSYTATYTSIDSAQTINYADEVTIPEFEFYSSKETSFVYSEGVLFSFTDTKTSGILAHIAGSSPAKYSVSGIAGKKITKVEVNVSEAKANIQTQQDTTDIVNINVNYQIWLYQETDVIELRYGPNSNTISDFRNAYDSDITAVLFSGESDANCISLHGSDAISPNVDQFDYNLWIDDNYDYKTLGAAVPDGMVYRFSPIRD